MCKPYTPCHHDHQTQFMQYWVNQITIDFWNTSAQTITNLSWKSSRVSSKYPSQTSGQLYQPMATRVRIVNQLNSATHSSGIYILLIHTANMPQLLSQAGSLTPILTTEHIPSNESSPFLSHFLCRYSYKYHYPKWAFKHECHWRLCSQSIYQICCLWHQHTAATASLGLVIALLACSPLKLLLAVFNPKS